MQSEWQVFLSVSSVAKAEKAIARLSELAHLEFTEPTIEPYHKGGFVAAVSVAHEGTSWPAIVIDVLATAQRAGNFWLLLGDVETELDLVCNEPSGGFGATMISISAQANRQA